MKNRLEKIRSKLSELKGERKRVQEDLKESKIKARRLQRDLGIAEKSLDVLRVAAQLTQKQLEYQVGNFVSLAMRTVFGDSAYEFKLKFEQRRNNTEADLLFVRNGQEMKPIFSSGGGAVDVASFGLRVAIWSLRQKKLRDVLLLDEPFKHLSIDLQEYAGNMIKLISEKLKLQIIEISHVLDIVDYANKVFDVTINEGVSKVKIL